MLGIQNKDGSWIQWHVNEPVPEVKGPVVTFRADCDELNYLLTCMEKVYYSKIDGTLFSNHTRPILKVGSQ